MLCARLCTVASCFRDLFEILTARFEHSGFTREALPASNGHVDIPRTDIHRVAYAPSLYGCYDSRAGSNKRVIDSLPRIGVIYDWPSHALDRLLRAMAVAGVVGPTNIPERALIPRSAPGMFRSFLH